MIPSGHKHGLCLDSDRALKLAHNTGSVFPDIPEKQNLRDIEAIRRRFTASLTPLGNLIDLLRENITLFTGQD